jgi:hypothetical protein
LLRIGLFLLANYVSRREIYSKQSRSLGGVRPLARPRVRIA